MRLKRTRTMTLAVVLILAGLYAVFAVVAAAPALATGGSSAQIVLTAYEQDMLDHRVTVQVLDLVAGDLNDYALLDHYGAVRCDAAGTCSGGMGYQYGDTGFVEQIDLNFESLDHADSQNGAVDARGTATINSDDLPLEVPFTASVIDNKDGTLTLTAHVAPGGQQQSTIYIQNVSGSVSVTGYDFLEDGP